MENKHMISFREYSQPILSALVLHKYQSDLSQRISYEAKAYNTQQFLDEFEDLSSLLYTYNI